MTRPIHGFAKNNFSAPAFDIELAVEDADFTHQARCLLVGSGGTANIKKADGTVVNSVPLQTGYNPIQCEAIMAGGTASNIWALF